MKQCKLCRLYKTRITPVCAEGPVPSRFMFIAQAPGRTENTEGKILIGPSGKVFDQLLFSLHFKRDDIYITNLVKCFLPKCRKPRQDEIETCYGLFLKKEIELVKPEIIVTLGFHVTKFIFGLFGFGSPNKIELKSIFGNLFMSKNKKIVPLRHPAVVVHKSVNIKKLIKEYKILNVLQAPCTNIKICTIYNNYLKGLTPTDYIHTYCYGNWEKCKYFLNIN